jgi:hypothetical protein
MDQHWSNQPLTSQTGKALCCYLTVILAFVACSNHLAVPKENENKLHCMDVYRNVTEVL